MEIGFKKAPTWRFSGIGKIYGSGTFSVSVLFFCETKEHLEKM